MVSRIQDVFYYLQRKMTGSSLIEDPGMPLVNKNGKYSKYVNEDTESVSSFGPITPTPSKFDNISYRLSRRKKLINQRRKIVDLEFALTVIGITLMIIDTELFISILPDVYLKSSAASIAVKSVVSISTVGLLIAVCAYHVVGIQLHMVENGLEDWRLSVTPWTYCKVILELCICVIHPLPGNIELPYTPRVGETRMVSIDAFLSILMLLRLYICGKFIVNHSKLLTDTSTQSLGALNKVKINTVFVFKALMSTKPGTMLMAIMSFMFITNSWAMRTCEFYYHPDSEHTSFGNAMWLIAITFLTVGYGDITPNSYCGRFISVVTGVMGVGTTALLVAVLAAKLEQSRSEKYVHSFVSRIHLDKERKHAASDVIKNVIRLWRIKKRGNFEDKKRIHHHGKLLQAIQCMRSAKNEAIQIGEGSIGVIEVSKCINDVFEIVETMQLEQTELKSKIDSMETNISSINSKINALHSAMVEER